MGTPPGAVVQGGGTGGFRRQESGECDWKRGMSVEDVRVSGDHGHVWSWNRGKGHVLLDEEGR